MSQREPDRRTILIEMAVYALAFVLIGLLFVAARAMREGPRVVNFDVKDDAK